MLKNMINDIKQNWVADLLFVISGTMMGFVIKFAVSKIFG